MLKKLEKLLFYLFVFSLPFQTRVILYQWGQSFNEWTSAYLYWTDILLILIFLLWFWRNKNNRYLKNFKISIGKWVVSYNFWLAVFAAISFCSISMADNLYLGFYHWVKLLEFIVLFFYLKHVIPAKAGIQEPQEEGDSRFRGNDREYGNDNGFEIDFRKLVYVFVFSGLVQSCIAIRQYAVQSSLGLKYLMESPLNIGKAGVANFAVGPIKLIRPYGTFPHPNVLAAFLLISIFFLYFVWMGKGHSHLKKCLLLIAYFTLLLALFVSFSRTSVFIFLLASLIYLGISFWLGIKKRNRALFRKSIFIFSLLVIFCLIFVWLARPEALARFRVSSEQKSFSMRVFYNSAAFSAIANYPFMGLGIGNSVWGFRNTHNLLASWIHQPVHNIYLLVAAESGLIGLIAFLFFLFLLFKRIFRPEQLVFCLLLFAVLFIGLFDHFFWTLQQGQLMFWLVLGIVTMVDRQSEINQA